MWTEEEELKKIRDQDNWPLFPRLPVKRRIGPGEQRGEDGFGIMIGTMNDADPDPVIYLRTHDPETDLKQAIRYESLEALVKEWVGD